jgi:hypothetical protein
VTDPRVVDVSERLSRIAVDQPEIARRLIDLLSEFVSLHSAATGAARAAVHETMTEVASTAMRLGTVAIAVQKAAQRNGE